MDAQSERDRYYDFVKKDLIRLRVEWRVYRSFFGKNEETVNMLNKISGPTTAILQGIMFDAVLLGLRRITDKSSSNKKRENTVSLMRLPQLFDPSDKDLTISASRARHATGFARNWADKKIAHRDLSHAKGEFRLMPASRQKVEDALSACASTIKLVSSKYYDTHLVTHPISPANDETQFLKILYEGLGRYEQKKEKRKALMLEGKYEEARNLLDYPSWIQREDPPFD